MFTFGNDTVRNSTFTLDASPESEQNVYNIPYDGMRAKLFLVYRWQFQKLNGIEYEKFQRYVNTTAIQVDTDWF